MMKLRLPDGSRMARTMTGSTRGRWPGPLAGGIAAVHAATVVPLQGQTPEEVAADRQRRAAQASGQSGHDPAAPATPAAASTPRAGHRVAGAARGAVTGKVVSNVTKNSTDDAVEGGAKLGAMAGGSRQRRTNRDQRQQAQQQRATEQRNAGAYDSSLAACLQARGYAVQ